MGLAGQTKEQCTSDLVSVIMYNISLLLRGHFNAEQLSGVAWLCGYIHVCTFQSWEWPGNEANFNAEELSGVAWLCGYICTCDTVCHNTHAFVVVGLLNVKDLYRKPSPQSSPNTVGSKYSVCATCMCTSVFVCTTQCQLVPKACTCKARKNVRFIVSYLLLVICLLCIFMYSHSSQFKRACDNSQWTV